MPAENFSTVNRGSTRKNAAIGIFRIRSDKSDPEWRKTWLKEILKTREPTKHFKAMIAT